jgi:hypothetical protein
MVMTILQKYADDVFRHLMLLLAIMLDREVAGEVSLLTSNCYFISNIIYLIINFLP